MTDRELLKLAAKAAGLQIATWGEPDDYSPRNSEVAYIQDDERGWYEWNPLDDDGDALRLAANLKLEIRFTNDFVIVDSMKFVDYNDDILAAVRKGIVLVAAEIGRAMD